MLSIRAAKRIILKLRSSSMEKGVLLGVCFVCILGEVVGMTQPLPRNRVTRPIAQAEEDEAIDPLTVSMIANRASIPKTGLPPKTLKPGATARGSVQPRGRLREVIVQVNQSINSRKTEFRPASRESRANFPFGPHLLSSETARRIGSSGKLFVETTLEVNTRELPVFGELFPEDKADLGCPFSEVVQCNVRSPYRTITGACNNIRNPLWGSSNTPFERSLYPAYNDGYSTPRSRSVTGHPLPRPRVISTTIHTASGVRHLDRRFTHITMEFGQFVSHDTERFAPITTDNGEELVCCDSPTRKSNREGCLAIDIPANDPFFSKYGRRCMEFARALASPNLQCKLGVREQLNQESAYLDASAVYGSTQKLNTELRSFTGGLLKTARGPDGELLLKDTSLTPPQCISQTLPPKACFKAGDARVNQQPALMSMHTIWLREHNRVARKLATLNRNWGDERIFQEARKIVGAEFQHVVYNEFLPVLVGDYVANAFDFPALKNGYNSYYDPSINAQIRSEFSSAGYRVGHTLIQTLFADGHKFQDHFLRSDVLYTKSTSFVIKNLFTKNQQKCDRLMSPQLTSTLLQQTPGSGIDLAAVNIQRGRDFGTNSYNEFRSLCGLPRAKHFGTRRGGLVSHNNKAAGLLKKTYRNVEDIDLWTGAVSERLLRGAVVGPTIACIISRQFYLLKKGDRFFYEHNSRYAKFSLNQLDAIRKTSFARIICDTTTTNTAQKRVFRSPSRSNPTVNCRNIPSVDLSLWGTGCVNGGWSSWSRPTRCYSGYSIQYRRCNNPTPSACGKKCVGNSFRWQRCGRSQSSRKGPLEVARELAPKGIVI